MTSKRNVKRQELPDEFPDLFLSRTDLDNLIGSLAVARQAGFSTSSSTIIPKIETLIDLALRLADDFKSGAFAQSQANPELQFKDSVYDTKSDQMVSNLDELGNPKQIKVRFPRSFVVSSYIADWFNDLAKILVRLKQGVGSSKSFKKLLARINPSKQKISRESKFYFHRRSHSKGKDTR